MAKLKDLTGKKFGKWLVLFRTQAHRKHTIWRCRCECGEEKDVYSTHLLQGNSSSCLKCSKKSGPEHPQWKGCGRISGDFFDSIRRGATGDKGRRKSVPFEITIEQIWELFLQQNEKCALSGQEITLNYKHSGHTASLDRIDSSKGYTMDNVQWVHKDINMMKRTYDQDYFVRMCKLVAKNMEGNDA